jgi:hypothetical protein
MVPGTEAGAPSGTAQAHAGGGAGGGSGGVRLKCDPRFEAQIYTGFHNGYDNLASMRADTTIVAGGKVAFMAPFGDSDAVWADIAARARARLVMMPDDGHFMVMQSPAACADMAASAFGWAGPAAAAASSGSARARL